MQAHKPVQEFNLKLPTPRWTIAWETPINWNASAFRAMNVKVLDETADSIWQDTAPQYLLSHNKLEES